MKHFFTTFFLFCLIIYTASANSPIFAIPSSVSDTVLFRNGDIYKVRVKEITSEKVFYKRYSDEEVRFFLIQDVKSVLFDDGKIVSFDNQNSIVANPSPIIKRTDTRSPKEMYELGYQDGKIYYNHRSIFWAGFGMAFLTYIGLGVTAIISLISPNINNLAIHDTRIMFGESSVVFRNFKDSNYTRGYQRGARGKKAGKVWLGFLAGIGVLLLLLLLLIALYR